MRQIKFRGRDLSGKYRFGFYAESGDVPYIIENCTWHEVAPDSVAQLVGHDKNGREVYEGDVLITRSGFEYQARMYPSHLSEHTLKENCHAA